MPRRVWREWKISLKDGTIILRNKHGYLMFTHRGQYIAGIVLDAYEIPRLFRQLARDYGGKKRKPKGTRLVETRATPLDYRAALWEMPGW